MQYFIDEHSIVRRIWGKADTVLFIFAGAAAEFALNKAVDWLYFTGKLPADPLGRLFSTVTYARRIIFAPHQEALNAIDQINKIHHVVEHARGAQIPDWAYRDVLYMLIDYSVRSFELLERRLTAGEKEQVFDAFYKVGRRMNIPGLPANYEGWLIARAQHLQNNMISSNFTIHLFEQYKKHLGRIRYSLLKQVWLLITPAAVRQLLPFKGRAILTPVIGLYKLSRFINVDKLIKEGLLPQEYKARIKALDMA